MCILLRDFIHVYLILDRVSQFNFLALRPYYSVPYILISFPILFFLNWILKQYTNGNKGGVFFSPVWFVFIPGCIHISGAAA